MPTPIAPTAIKLALLWTSVMFLYIYNDYFMLYMPGEIEGMQAGRIGPLGAASEAVMVGVSAMLAIPALMIALSVLLPRPASRWLNGLFGLIYTAIEVLTLTSPHLFYKMVVVLEIAATLTIVALAWRWPREEAQ
jgi:hypothetical protein